MAVARRTVARGVVAAAQRRRAGRGARAGAPGRRRAGDRPRWRAARPRPPRSRPPRSDRRPAPSRPWRPLSRGRRTPPTTRGAADAPARIGDLERGRRGARLAGKSANTIGGGGGVDQVVPPLVGGLVGDARLEGGEEVRALAAGQALVLDGPAQGQHRAAVEHGGRAGRAGPGAGPRTRTVVGRRRRARRRPGARRRWRPRATGRRPARPPPGRCGRRRPRRSGGGRPSSRSGLREAEALLPGPQHGHAQARCGPPPRRW